MGINLGYYNGKEIWPRNVTERNISSKLCHKQICLIWKSENVSFNKAIKELKEYFKMVNNYITGENIISHFEYRYRPKKVDSHLNNFIV